MEDCIKKNTFTQEDVLHDVLFGFKRRKGFSLMKNDSFLNSLNTSWQETQMFVSLYSNFTYQLLIYDPKFFVELDTTDDPCNDDPNYHFQRCVTESLSSKVSCECFFWKLCYSTFSCVFTFQIKKSPESEFRLVAKLYGIVGV